MSTAPVPSYFPSYFSSYCSRSPGSIYPFSPLMLSVQLVIHFQPSTHHTSPRKRARACLRKSLQHIGWQNELWGPTKRAGSTSCKILASSTCGEKGGEDLPASANGLVAKSSCSRSHTWKETWRESSLLLRAFTQADRSREMTFLF